MRMDHLPARCPGLGLVLGLVLSLVLALAGCTGNDNNGDDGSRDEPSSSPTATTSPTASSSAGVATPTPTTSETVTPLSGTTVQMIALSITLPEGNGWRLERDRLPTRASSYTRGATIRGQILVDNTPAITSDVDGNARTWLKILRQDGYELRRLRDRTIEGVTGWVFKGIDSLGDAFYGFGTVHQGQVVTVDVHHRRDVDGAAEFHDQVTEPLLASIQWT